MKIIKKHLNQVIKEANKSTNRFKIGALIFNKKAVISTGHNYAKKSVKHLLPIFQKRKNAVHAEVDSIIKAKTDLKGMSMLVIRLNAYGGLALARPCNYCMTYIDHVGIKNIYYSNRNGDIERIKL